MKKILFLTILASFLLVGNAMAVPFTFGDGGDSLQGALDDITQGPNSGVSSIDVTADSYGDALDSYWNITGTGASVSTVVIEIADFEDTNLFGIYDPEDENNSVQLFGGAATTGSQVTLSITALGDIYVNGSDTLTDFSGTSFGYYLDSSAEDDGGIWYSDTDLNSDNTDHMVAYQGLGIDTVQIDPWAAGLWTTTEYVLAFEDLTFDQDISDADYSDFVVMVESVNPVPEPATMLLLGSGLVGLAGLGRKRFSKKA